MKPLTAMLVLTILALGGCLLFESDPAAPVEQEENGSETTYPDVVEDVGDVEVSTNDVEENSTQTNGVSPRVADLVSSEEYDRLVIEVDVVSGQQLRGGVAERLTQGLVDVVDKPGGIEVVFDEVVGVTAPAGGWTFIQLQELVGQYANLEVAADTITAYTLLVDGHYADSAGNVLGIAWANRYTVLFLDSIEDACRGMGLLPLLEDQLCENAQLTVWRHEMGHVLGLVNIGAPIQSDHEDVDRRAHCTNEQCVMYWAFRNASMMDRLSDRLLDGDSSAPDFDESCLQDLEAVQQ